MVVRYEVKICSNGDVLNKEAECCELCGSSKLRSADYFVEDMTEEEVWDQVAMYGVQEA